MIAGIDPGLDGAIAFLADGVLRVVDMPTLTLGKKRTIDEIEFARIVDAAGPIEAAFLEQVATRPGEGAVGAFSFGRGYGFLRGVLRASFVPITDVTPSKWKRAFGIPPGSGKDHSRHIAKCMFQRDAGLFARVKDDGRSEAALIALYGTRSLAGLL